MFRRNKQCYALLVILSVWIILVSIGCGLKKLDHFKIYEVQKFDFDLVVLLEGQFDKEEVKARITALTHFANPTNKFHPGSKTKIRDPNAHLNWYVLKQMKPEPRRAIHFENQFGEHSVVIRSPQALLVPAQKTSHQGSKFPRSLDHYKCYEVTTIKSMPKLPVVNLEDQFGSENQVKIRKPELFCVPVSKNRPDIHRSTEIKNKEDHLAIYPITPKPYRQKIKTRDQFESLELRVTRSVMFAVPSKKKSEVIQKPDTLDHFKIYEVSEVPFEKEVLLKGQFDDNEINAWLTTLTHFANPTSKYHANSKTEIKDPDAHLNWYDLKQEQPEPRRTIRFKNQFGQHSVETQDPRNLLVPAQKINDQGHNFPDSLDHYKCYNIIEINTMPNLPNVTLKDQFTLPTSEDSVQVLKPRLFCVPVSKNLPQSEPIGKIMNDKDHLVIYDIHPRPHERQTASKDQFGDKPLVVKRSVMLAVPTEKQAVVPHQE